MRELKGFAKVALNPGETKSVSFTLTPRELAYFDVAGHQWKADAGDYEVEIGASSRDIRLTAPLQLQQEFSDILAHGATPDTLTAQEQADGWKLLWDGKTTAGWRSPKSDEFPDKSWQIPKWVLSVVSSGNAEAQAGGDIITRDRYANFELVADFKTTTGCNSGIKIFVQPNIPPLHKAPGQLTSGGSAIGMEFQILDDAHHPDAKLGRDGDRTIGSLYDLIPAPQRQKSHACRRVESRAYFVARPARRVLVKWPKRRWNLNAAHRPSAPPSLRASSKTSPTSASGRTANFVAGTRERSILLQRENPPTAGKTIPNVRK